MKKIFLTVLVVLCLGNSGKAHALLDNPATFTFLNFDLPSIIGRTVQVAVKYFLKDDTKIIAELVYDGEEGSSGGSGGCGGAYTGSNGSVDYGLALNAVASSITDIPAETGAYPSDVKVQDTSIAKLADLRIKEIVKENASLDELSQDKWAILYRAQQRSIQAMTDALVMKKAYKELAAIAGGISSGRYDDYSAATSTVATRRLLLDALLALRKRVVAARVRARAETIEMTIDAVSTAPMIEGGETTESSKSTMSDSSPVVAQEAPSSDVEHLEEEV